MIRSVAVLGLGVLILAGVGGCATSKPTLKASDSAVVSIDGPITSPTATLVVHGMSCLLCASNVDKQLLDVGGCATFKPTPKPSDSAVVSTDEPITSATATLVVHGMSCPLCASNVDKQLLDVPGVSGVNVNMNTGHVAITIDPKQPPTRDMLARAINRSGFALAEVRTP